MGKLPLKGEGDMRDPGRHSGLASRDRVEESSASRQWVRAAGEQLEAHIQEGIEDATPEFHFFLLWGLGGSGGAEPGALCVLGKCFTLSYTPALLNS